jgi:hypothetical protein
MRQYFSVFKNIFLFYYEGFRNMSGWGKKVWLIILIKLFIMFAVLKIFFFQDFLTSNFHTDKERSEHVLEQLTNSPDNHDR